MPPACVTHVCQVVKDARLANKSKEDDAICRSRSFWNTGF